MSQPQNTTTGLVVIKRGRVVRLLAAGVVAALVAAACGGGDDGGGDDTSADEPTAAAAASETTTAAAADAATGDAATTTAPPTTTTEPPTTTTAEPPTTTAPATAWTPGAWEWVDGTEDCACADGSEFSFLVREADPTRLVFFLDGGGACFSAESCSFTDGTYTVTVSAEDDPTGAGGIFDFTNPANPLADYSFVAVPYCTGDVHLGNASTAYSEDLVVLHNGYINATTALAEAVARFGGTAEHVVVAGSSAGSAGAPLYAGLAADEFPDASITMVADASGAYPSVGPVNALIGGVWGTHTVVPDWPVNEGMTPEEWGLVELSIQAGKHAPRIRFSRFDNAFDSTQVFYASLAGFDSSSLDQLIKANVARIEAAGVPVMSYLAPGEDHTILWLDEMYSLEVEGVAFVDWLTAVIAGEDVDDVICQDCT